MSETTERRMNPQELFDHCRKWARKWMSQFPSDDDRQTLDSLTSAISDGIIAYERELNPTPPASEPSEQPVAEDASELLIRLSDDGMPLPDMNEEQLDQFAREIEKYARHASARAVEAERQRLLRLVDEEIKLYSIPLTEEHYKDEALRQDRNTWRRAVVFGLKKVASWLADDVGEKTNENQQS